MAVVIERDGVEEWIVQCAPQCMTDILVQVSRMADPENVVFTFQIGELMREALEDCGDLLGMLQCSDQQAAVLERYASLLEIYAEIMRSALKCRWNPGQSAPSTP